MTYVPTCVVCGASDDVEELRPYGPDGAPICYPCGTSPEHQAETQAQLLRRLGVGPQ